MAQSNVIFGVLLIAYLIFITMRGELPIYLNLLRGVKAETSPHADGGSFGEGLGEGIGQELGKNANDIFRELYPDYLN